MENVDQAMSAVRRLESNGNYRAQQRVNINGLLDYKVGAYGIVQSKWAGLAASLGYMNAGWQDRKMQDIIAKEKLEHDYKELGSWELAVVSFRYGMPIARHLIETENVEPEAIEMAGYEGIANYVRSARNFTKQDHPIEGKLRTGPVENEPKSSPKLRRSESIVKNQLVSMRNAQRGRSAAPALEDVTAPTEELL